MQTFEKHGRVCMCCGDIPGNGIRLVVDHIKPIGEFWDLRLDPDNVQILCNDCNMGKGNWLVKDFRPEVPPDCQIIWADTWEEYDRQKRN
jgi:5-methylcytosine-specific restriction endonuclease McrA